MNIQAQIALAEQLTNALKEIERLQKENDFFKSNRDLYLDENVKLRRFIKENRLEIPKDLDCPF